MRWEGGRRSQNVEDRRKMGGGAKMAMGGGGILVLIIAALLGINPGALTGGGGGGGLGGALGGALGGQGGGGQTGVVDPAEEKLAEFISVVLGDTEDTWKQLFQKNGKTYPEPTLVLFRGEVKSACGHASAAMGPFYCGGDQKVYIDLAFYDELKTRFGAPGDFAQAYVIAHEVGHHIQHLLGKSDWVHAQKGKVSEEEYNKLSVKLELQADFYAGIWAHYANRSRGVVEAGDIEEALRCAQAIGDDKIQMQSRGYIVPESFTHGTAEQRARWFRLGFESGDLSRGDTFSARDL